MKGRTRKENRFFIPIVAVSVVIVLTLIALIVSLIFLVKQKNNFITEYGNFKPSGEYSEPVDQVIEETTAMNDGSEDSIQKISRHFDDAAQYYLINQDANNATQIIVSKITFLSTEINCDAADKYVENLDLANLDAKNSQAIYSYMMSSAVECGDDAMYEKWSNAYASLSK